MILILHLTYVLKFIYADTCKKYSVTIAACLYWQFNVRINILLDENITKTNVNNKKKLTTYNAVLCEVPFKPYCMLNSSRDTAIETLDVDRCDGRPYAPNFLDQIGPWIYQSSADLEFPVTEQASVDSLYDLGHVFLGWSGSVYRCFIVLKKVSILRKMSS
jgi:hypothetical protein